MVSRQPKLSVVIPTYNREKTIVDSIKSIQDQTFKDWEIVVVDDGSTDNTEQVIKDLNDDRIIYKKIAHTGLIGNVRNIGNEIAKSDIIVIQDSDDYSYPERLEKIYDYFQNNPEVELMYHAIKVKFLDGEEKIVGRENFSRFRILREQYLPGVCSYKKTAWAKYPYDNRMTVCDDMPWHIHHSLNGTKYGRIDDVLYSYIVRRDSSNLIGALDGRRVNDYKIIMDIFRSYDINIKFDLVVADTKGNKIKKDVV